MFTASTARKKKPTPISAEQDAAYASLTALLHMRILARGVRLSNQRKLLSAQSGLHTSGFRGRGIDFSEVRAYQLGDDIRSIDWRVTARTGKPHTKLYSEERERPVIILIDQRQRMFFGSRMRFKSVMASHCASLLAWAALERGDRVGGVTFSDREHREVRPKRNAHTVLALLETILEFNHQLDKHVGRSHVGLRDMLQVIRQTTKPGSELFIISDFSDFDEGCENELFHLARHNDPVCIRVNDPLEHQLPPPGQYALTDGNHREKYDFAQPKLRNNWQETHALQEAEFARKLTRLKIPTIQLATDAELVATLQRGLGIFRGRAV